MAKCERCLCWYPSKPGPTKEILVPLFHDHLCVYHYGLGDEYDFELEALVGRLFGTANLMIYQFKGNLLYETDNDGKERVVATFTDFPKTPEQKAREAETKRSEPNSDWERWKAERKALEALERAAVSSERAEVSKESKSLDSKPKDAFSFHIKPWESVDRKTQPNLWWFYFKCAFLPGIHKDLKYDYSNGGYSGYSRHQGYQGSHYHNGHWNSQRGIYEWDGG